MNVSYTMVISIVKAKKITVKECYLEREERSTDPELEEGSSYGDDESNEKLSVYLELNKLRMMERAAFYKHALSKGGFTRQELVRTILLAMTICMIFGGFFKLVPI